MPVGAALGAVPAVMLVLVAGKMKEPPLVIRQEDVPDPVGAVLEYDVLSWDDHLEAGDGVGTLLPDAYDPRAQVTGWDPSRGYAVQRVGEYTVTNLQVVIEEPVVRRFGSVDVEVREEGGKIVGRVVETPVELARLGLDPAEGGGVAVEGAPQDAPTDRLTVDSLAPFPVTIDLRTATLIGGPVALPDVPWPLVAGMKVRADGRVAEILETDGTRATVRFVETEYRPELRLPNPDDRRLPFWWVLVTAGVVGVPFLARRLPRWFKSVERVD